MVFSYLVHEGLKQPDGNRVGALVVVAVAGEIAFGFIVLGESCLVSHDVYLRILDGADGIHDVTEACDARCERPAHVGVDKCHLCCLVEVLVVHVMDEVERFHVDAGQPLEHGVETRHEFVVGEHVGRDRAVSRTDLLACAAVNTTVNGIKKGLCEVRPRAEELHFLSRLRRAHATTYRIVVSPNRSHHIVIFILYGACRNRNLGGVMAKCLGKSAAIEHREVGFGRRSHVFKRVKEAEVVLRHHRTAVLPHAGNFERSPNRVAGEQLVVGRNACELHHSELHHEMIDKLLRLLLGQFAFLEVAFEVDVEEG